MSRTPLKWLVLLVSSVASLLLLELAFRSYEERFLIRELAPEARFYDLEKLRYNDHEGILPRTKEAGEFRILSFGDSFAESATDAQYAYASVLQQELEAVSATERIRVVNLGKAGRSFPGYLAQYRAWSRQVEFDAVLLNLYSGNDFFDLRGVVHVAAEVGSHRALRGGDAPLRYGPGLEIPHRYALRVFDYGYALLYSWLYAVAEDGHAGGKGPYRDKSLQYPRDVYLASQSRQVSVLRPDSMERYFDAYFWLYKLLLTARELERQGVPTAISVAPPHFVVDEGWRGAVLAHAGIEPAEIDLDLPAAVVAMLAREIGFEGPIIDFSDCLRRLTESGGEPYWGTNTHWSVEGNRLVGQLLAAELAPRWLGVTPSRDARDLLGCSCEVKPVSEQVARGIDEAIPVIHDLLRFEEIANGVLLGRRFRDRSELAEALALAGWREGSRSIVGRFEGFTAAASDRISRPHGLRRFLRPHGWALDRTRLGESLFVLIIEQGEVIGIARTREPIDAEQAAQASVPAGTANVGFRTVIGRHTPRGGRGEDLWVAALSPAGRFVWLQ